MKLSAGFIWGRVKFMSEEITRTVVRTLAGVKKIPAETIAIDATLESLRIDSLDKITLLFELEKAFNLNIPDESANSIRTVADIVTGIQALTSASNATAAPAAE